MTRTKKVIVALVTAVVGAGFLLQRACTVEEHWTDSYVLSEVAEANKLENLDGTPCSDICPKPPTEREVSYRHCGTGKRTYSPYILCEIGLTSPDASFVGLPTQALPFPHDLDPNSQGAIDLSYCPPKACIDRYTLTNNYVSEKFKVTGCRVASNEDHADAPELLVCSYTIKFGFFEAMDIMAR